MVKLPPKISFEVYKELNPIAIEGYRAPSLSSEVYKIDHPKKKKTPMTLWEDLKAAQRDYPGLKTLLQWISAARVIGSPRRQGVLDALFLFIQNK